MCEFAIIEPWTSFVDVVDYHRYGSAFGSPVARVQGIGYIQELVARLTHTPIKTHNTSTNATLNDNPITFPLGQSLYVDATHEVVVLNSKGFFSSSVSSYLFEFFFKVITALNLTTFAESGPLPYTHIPHDRTFRSAELAPFATNIQFQRAYTSICSSDKMFLTSLHYHQFWNVPHCQGPKSELSSTMLLLH